MDNHIYVRDEREEIARGEIRFTRALNGLLRRAVNRTLLCENYPRVAEVSILLVTPARIRELNRAYRGVDSETDVLSFPIDDRDFDDGEPAVLGDIVLCPAVAAQQARRLQHSVEQELAFLTVHSVLHLLGYDHENIDDEDKMLAHQRKVMDLLLSRKFPGRSAAEKM